MDKDRFCFVFGSFLFSTSKRTDSDIDLLCSRGVSAQDIRNALLKRYPDLSMNVRLDINYVDPVDGVINHPICYWQDGTTIRELFNDAKIKVNPIRRYDIGAYLRDPDKSMFRNKLLSSNVIQFSNTNYSKVIDRHYGKSIFMGSLKGLESDERQLYEKLYETKWNLHKSCSNLFSINRNKKRITLDNSDEKPDTEYTFPQFIEKCLKHNLS